MSITVAFNGAVESVQAQIIPNATSKNDGVMTKEQAAQLSDLVAEGPIVATENLTIYVSPTGNDNNPGTQAEPVRTLGGAAALLPVAYDKECRIKFLPGVFTEPGSLRLALPRRHDPGASAVIFEGALTNEVGNRVNDAAPSQIEIGDSTLGGVLANQYVGATLQCVSGANAGQARLVRANTASPPVFTVNAPFSNPTAPGDVFQIQRPAVEIHYPDFVGLLCDNLVMYGIKWVADTGDSNMLVFSYCAIPVVQSCEFELNGTDFSVNVPASQFISGGGRSDAFVGGAPFSELAGPAGAYFHDGSISNFGFMAGFYVLDNMFFYVSENGICELTGITMYDSQIFAEGAGSVSHEASALLAGLVDGCLDPAAAPWFFTDRSGNPFGLFDLEFRNCPAGCLTAFEGAILRLHNVTDDGSNAGYGIFISFIADVVYDPVDTTVSGAAGDVLVGSTPQTYAAINAGPGFTDGYNRIFPKT